MRVLVTGAAGRVGRAISLALMPRHDVIGLDRLPSSTSTFVGDIRDSVLLGKALDRVEVIVHVAGLHAPHVGLVSDNEFEQVNVQATEQLVRLGIKQGIKHFVFTSTTALYGFASTPVGAAAWIDEQVIPQPRTVYHRSKIQAEQALKEVSRVFNLPVTVLQMSRCFPEPADLMALYRLTRGIDARDAATAHVCAVEQRLDGFRRYIISGKTPFKKEQCKQIYENAGELISGFAPDLAAEFLNRHWRLPESLDRIYDSTLAQRELGWRPKYGYESVLTMLDNQMPEVLQVITN